MMLLNLGLLHKPQTVQLESERLSLRLPLPSDWVQWFYIRERNRSFLQPWEPSWPEGQLTKEYYYQRLLGRYKKQHKGQGCYYHIFEKSTGELIGGISLLHIIRAALQCSSIGYWIGQEYSSNGFMTEAVQTILPHAFETLNLHRVQASVSPLNAPSQRLLRNNNFIEEGMARKYFKANGEWKDTIMFSLNKEEWLAGLGATVSAGKLVQIDT